MKKKTRMPQFIKASGAPFSDKDIQLIGVELLKIAEAHRIDDIRLLDKKIVFAVLEADLNHPLWRFYDRDVKSAARKHWIAWTHKIIMSVRIEWKIGKFTKPLPLTLSCEVPAMKQGTTRKRVLTRDALLNDPVFSSAVGFRLRSMDTTLGQLETLISAYGAAEPAVRKLLEGLRLKFNEYYAALKEGAA